MQRIIANGPRAVMLKIGDKIDNLRDAVNHPNFLSPILRPGETYRQTSLFAFARG